MRDEVIYGIETERAYQDEKHGTIEEHPHTVMEWIAIMRNEIQEAETAWLKKSNPAALLEVLQVVATGVACLEQHGVYVRA